MQGAECKFESDITEGHYPKILPSMMPSEKKRQQERNSIRPCVPELEIIRWRHLLIKTSTTLYGNLEYWSWLKFHLQISLTTWLRKHCKTTTKHDSYRAKRITATSGLEISLHVCLRFEKELITFFVAERLSTSMILGCDLSKLYVEAIHPHSRSVELDDGITIHNVLKPLVRPQNELLLPLDQEYIVQTKSLSPKTQVNSCKLYHFISSVTDLDAREHEERRTHTSYTDMVLVRTASMFSEHCNCTIWAERTLSHPDRHLL